MRKNGFRVKGNGAPRSDSDGLHPRLVLHARYVRCTNVHNRLNARLHHSRVHFLRLCTFCSSTYIKYANNVHLCAIPHVCTRLHVIAHILCTLRIRNDNAMHSPLMHCAALARCSHYIPTFVRSIAFNAYFMHNYALSIQTTKHCCFLHRSINIITHCIHSFHSFIFFVLKFARSLCMST